MSALNAILRRHLEPTIQMLRHAVENCSDEVWVKADGNSPLWEHAFHATIWLHAWMRTPEEQFVAPPFFSDAALNLKPDAQPVISREQMKQYVAEVSERCHRLLDRADDALLLCEVDIMGSRYTLLDQTLGQLRHVQHHVGCMSTILHRHTNRSVPWVGYNEKPGN